MRKRNASSPRLGQILCGSFGIFGAIMGGVMIGVYPTIYDAILESQLIVKPGSTSFEMWESLPIPMYMKIFFFNCTNSEDIVNLVPGVKPNLVEVGPYTFKEHHKKVNISFDDSGETVTFQQVKTWHFIPEMSIGTLDDEITSVNVIAMAAAEYARFNPDIFFTWAIDGFFKETNATLFMTQKVRNLTFDGIYDGILDGAASTEGIQLPIPFDRFGWFYPRNGSAEYDSWFTMYTGEGDFDKVGQIKAWNNSERIREDIYTDYCATLNGSAGEFFPPHRDQTFVEFFTPDLCRTLRFNFKEETDFIGINAYKFYLDDSLIANTSTNPENWCFNPKADINQAVPNGMLNVSACKFNAPAFVSYPHFYMADPYYLEQFEPGSLKPEKDKHESHLMLEPVSGVPLDVKIRMQINVLVSPVNNTSDGINYLSVELIDGQKPTFYPLIWFETYTELDDETESLMKFLGIAPKLGIIIGVVIGGIGILMSAGALFMALRQQKQRVADPKGKYVDNHYYQDKKYPEKKMKR